MSTPNTTHVKVGTGGTHSRPTLNWCSKKFLFLAGSLCLLFVCLVVIILILRRPDSATDKENYATAVSSARDLDNRGNPDDAVAKLREYAASAQDPDQKAYAESLEGTIYERNGDDVKARAAYEKGVNLPGDKGGIAAHEGLARIETRAGNKDKAIEHWRKCIELKKSGIDYSWRAQDIMNYERYIKALGGDV